MMGLDNMRLKTKEIDYIITALYYYENILNAHKVNKIVIIFTSAFLFDSDFVNLDRNELLIVHNALVKLVKSLDDVNKDAISDILELIRRVKRELLKWE